ncbi:DUF6624 domain-containing protein [Hymenobacter jeollabukensis]|uniref:Tetratricopeptide repeat protein n=1 Tax=Hymenobacter jeollabukensis TaxID=2025313 RepID=A0A5R8WTA9_9BACT|nr:DUF6624 domain-containing protein [Hymenobacter jeollabukensis]TLM94998.1 hypothetical protein FDY95_04135 [Hymenobacter jeollabukensis]
MLKNLLFSACLLLSVTLTQAQTADFVSLNRQAMSAYLDKRYAEAGKLFDQALKDKKAHPGAGDYYNAACAWALAGNKDQAFRYLDLATAAGWENVAHLKQDSDLNALHADKRWQPMLTKLETAVARIQANYDKPLKQQLDSIYASDQGGRQQYASIKDKYGEHSPEMQALWKQMAETDARNLKKITALLDQRGWPSKAKVGNMGTQTVFLVIQHSDLPTMQKYFPMAQQAMERGDLAKSAFALLQDRFLMWQGKPQIYGSQLVSDTKTGKMAFHPIEDEAHVDERRATMGLGPLTDYAKNFGLDYHPPQP